MRAKISIVTPTFNQAQFLEQTIDSILSQNYTSLQYIIIDGGSTDGSVDIIKRYQKYLHYWVSEPDNGQSHAINKGIQHATGEVINWLNSDDYLEPDSLKIIGENFCDPSVYALTGRSNIILNGKVIRRSPGTDIYEDNLEKTIGWARIDQPETFFRRSIFVGLGPLSESVHYVMDKELWIRYLLKYGQGNIRQIENVIANFRLHGQSKTQSQALRFFADTNTLFYQLAFQNDLAYEADFIRENLQINATELLQLKSNDKELARKAVHYFLLYKADELYYNNKTKAARQVLKVIDKTCLQRSDIALMKKLNFRSSLPKEIIMTIRKWKLV